MKLLRTTTSVSAAHGESLGTGMGIGLCADPRPVKLYSTASGAIAEGVHVAGIPFRDGFVVTMARAD